MDLVFAYLAGLMTLINPCVLPVLPIVLAGALQAGRSGPLLMAAGMAVAFTFFGLTVTAFGQAVGLTPEALSWAGAWAMLGFGLILLVPRFSTAFATATAGVAARADASLGHDAQGAPAARQLIAGLLLGAVWSPCIGPTLGGAIALASAGRSLAWAGAIMAAFSLGVATLILALGYGARAAILRRQAALRRFATWSRPLLGAAFVLVGLALILGWQHRVEGWALDHLPPWLTDLSVRF